MKDNGDTDRYSAPPSKMNLTLGLTSLGHFLNDWGFFLFPLVATIFSVEKDFTPILMSIMYAIYYGSSSLFTTFISYRVDKNKKVVGIAGGLLIYFVLKEALKGSKTANRENKGGTLKESLTKGVTILAVLTFFRSLAAQGIISWIPFYLSYTEGLGVGLSLGIMMTVMYSIAIVGQPFFGIMVDKFDKMYLLIITTVGTGIFTIGFILTRGYLSIAMIIVFAFFNFSAFPLLMSLTRDYVPKTSSVSNSLWGIASTGGTILGPVIVSAYLFDSYAKLTMTFEVLASIIIIIGLLTFLLPRSSTKSKMPLFM